MSQKEFLFQLYEAHRHNKAMPSPEVICSLITGLLQLLFPQLSDKRYTRMSEFEHDYANIKAELIAILIDLNGQLDKDVEAIADTFFQQLPEIRANLLKDADAMMSGDPAAVSNAEVIRTYPGFYAIAVYRLAHALYHLEVPLVPRILTEHAHNKTGVDIHPGASIGANFCIDHGTGIVIGGTAHIGNNVKIYQGVTLGALSVKKEMASTKRHPTIEDNVIIYAGATILGGQTVIGKDSIIGGNVWITKSTLPNSRVYYKGLNQEAKMARSL
ncbi:MAG: serine O-acetyltransferase EpsC [Bacteroidota bacterium]